MIRKLKIRFICLAMAILFIMLAIVVAAMNIINYNSMVMESDEILTFISQHNGKFPKWNNSRYNNYSIQFTPETPYESRYFSVTVDDNGDITKINTRKIAAVNTKLAKKYAKAILRSDKSSGFTDNFRYLKSSDADKTRIIFLDCGRKLGNFNKYLHVSISIAVAGLLVMFFVVYYVSGKIIKPVYESYAKQERFITDAGHEIKTPLTIINANVDLLESDPDDTDCLNDIRVQAARLTSLTNDLVYLARMTESTDEIEMVDFPVSDVISESVASFKALLTKKEITLESDISPMISMRGNHKAIQQLVSILMDNALKYSPVGGTVSVSFAKQNRTTRLNIYNDSAEEISQNDLKNVFERFYRADKSRNSETGGHGIGLSLAKGIVEAHGGKIFAWTKDGRSFNITCTFKA